MKKSLVLLLFLLHLPLMAQKKVVILGDSYSTFNGYIPSQNLCWYEGEDGAWAKDQIDVKKVEQTWWMQLITQNGFTLVKNDSYSGATICYTGYDKADFTDRAFITRMKDLPQADMIFICGGTNDSWADSPIGKFKYKNWKTQDLYDFRPAFAYMLSYLKKKFPQTVIVNICNSELKPEITESQQRICEHYHVLNVQLSEIDKIGGHPSAKGMAAIAKQVNDVINLQ